MDAIDNDDFELVQILVSEEMRETTKKEMERS